MLAALTTRVLVAPLHWRPAADVCETQAAITVVLEVAGLDEDDVEIALYPDALVIEGERRFEACGPDGVYHAAEIRRGPFRVEVGLPSAVDATGVEATYEAGLLRVVLPRQRDEG